MYLTLTISINWLACWVPHTHTHLLAHTHIHGYTTAQAASHTQRHTHSYSHTHAYWKACHVGEQTIEHNENAIPQQQQQQQQKYSNCNNNSKSKKYNNNNITISAIVSVQNADLHYTRGVFKAFSTRTKYVCIWVCVWVAAVIIISKIILYMQARDKHMLTVIMQSRQPWYGNVLVQQADR